MTEPTARIRLTREEVRLLDYGMRLVKHDLHLDGPGMRPPDLMLGKLRDCMTRIEKAEKKATT